MKPKESRTGIRYKLFACFAIFIALTLTLLWVLQVVFLDDFYKMSKINMIKKTATAITYNLNKSTDKLQTLVTRMSQEGELCIVVYDLNDSGAYLADSDVLVGCLVHKLMPHDRYRMCMSALEAGGESLELFEGDIFRNNEYSDDHFQGNVPQSDPGLYDSLIYIRVKQNNIGHNIAIMINGTIAPVDATVQTLINQMLIITIVMLLLAAGFAMILSRLIAKPISKLNNSAKALATANYDVSFHAKGYREIEELADSLGYAAKELSKVDEYRRELLANVSHDMRTPLTLISGYGEVMRDIPSENNAENLDIIISEAKRLTALVNDMLEQTKYEDGAIHIDSKPFDLSVCLNEIVDRYQKFIKNDGYCIHSDIERSLYVSADPIKITQAIYNLLNNAINYTGPDKQIYITLKQITGKTRLEIRDTGEGIPEEKLPHIWNRYYKIDKEHRRAVHGSGLGLSIVRNILELHHAQYGVISQVGQGSTFWFELPEEKTYR